MALSKREKYIAAGVGAAVALLAFDYAILGPFTDNSRSVDDRITAAQKDVDDNDSLFTRQHRLRGVWTDLTRGGLSKDPSAAESQALRAVLRWSDESGVSLSALKPDRSADENQFQVISFHVTATGSTPQVAKLMWDIETATVPIRLTDVQVVPRKEGTDDLSIQFGVSTLCQRQVTPKPAAAAQAAAGRYAEDRS